MVKRKVLLLDLDGTIISHDYIISDELLHECMKLSDRMNVFIATGRSASDAMRYYRQLALTDYLICNNGAFIWNPCTDEVLHCEHMKDGKRIMSFLLENYDKWQIDNVIVSSGINTYALNSNNKYLCEMMYDEELPYNFMTSDEMCQINMVHRIVISTRSHNTDEYIDALKRLSDDVDIFCWKGRSDIIDICMKSASKWAGINKILEKRNLFPEDVVAFGDARNDIPILENSGIGVAMCNADEHVKKAANYITMHDNDNNGVYFFIKNNPKLFR